MKTFIEEATDKLNTISACTGDTAVLAHLLSQAIDKLGDTMEVLQWMVDAHDSGLLVCREGTIGDKLFHENRLSCARDVITKGRERMIVIVESFDT